MVTISAYGALNEIKLEFSTFSTVCVKLGRINLTRHRQANDQLFYVIARYDGLKCSLIRDKGNVTCIKRCEKGLATTITVADSIPHQVDQH